MTCGVGLAAHANLVAMLGELLESMAEVLDNHQQALVLVDENTRPEHHAYVTLVLDYRAISAQLAGTAKRMTGYRDLPMGTHDNQKLSGPEARAALKQLVGVEKRLLSRLTEVAGDHAAIFERMS